MNAGATTLASERGEAPRILVVDDETLFGRAVCKRLEKAGMTASFAGSLGAAREALESGRPDLVVLDMRLPDGSGLDFLSELRAGEFADLSVVMLTAFGGLEDAVSAMKQDALDYLTKPIDLDTLVQSLERLLDRARLTRQVAYSEARERHAVEGKELLGHSDSMRQVSAQIARICALAERAEAAPPTLLILGETGTGKDLTARALHLGAGREGLPFIHVDCAALPKDLIEAELFGHEKGAFTGAHAPRTGLIEAAEGGTLFLDEVGELPLEVQGRLLAVLERRQVRRVGSSRERSVNAWFLAATNRDLDAMVKEGTFRSDLFFRLNVLTLHLPSLRDRAGDIAMLATHYAKRTARRYGLPTPDFAPETVAALAAYPWPGNVRELVNVIERGVLLSPGPKLQPSELGLVPVGITPTVPATGDLLNEWDELTLDEAEGLLIRRALDRTAGNVSEAARQLGVTRMALRYRLQKHGIDPKDGAPE